MGATPPYFPYEGSSPQGKKGYSKCPHDPIPPGREAAWGELRRSGASPATLHFSICPSSFPSFPDHSFQANCSTPLLQLVSPSVVQKGNM